MQGKPWNMPLPPAIRKPVPSGQKFWIAHEQFHCIVAMTFKESPTEFQMIDVSLIEPDPNQPRQNTDKASLKGLANSIQMKGLIHPLVVQSAGATGRYMLIVGDRRWRAAVIAGERKVPALIRACGPAEALEIQVFENMGRGIRTDLEPREMANAIQTIADRFESPEAAAEHFGRKPTWLTQATAAARLSPKISALLDSGKISSTGAAVQLEKLARKNEAKAESLIAQTAQLPEGETLARKTVDGALSEASHRRKTTESEKDKPASNQLIPAADDTSSIPPREVATDAQSSGRRRINPGKVKMVAKILGLADGDEEEILIRLIDEFLAANG